MKQVPMPVLSLHEQPVRPEGSQSLVRQFYTPTARLSDSLVGNMKMMRVGSIDITVITIHYFIIKKNNNYRFNSIAYNVKNSNLLPPICLSPQRGQVTAAVSFVFRLTKGNGSCRESYVGKKNTMFID